MSLVQEVLRALGSDMWWESRVYGPYPKELAKAFPFITPSMERIAQNIPKVYFRVGRLY
jgi:hypothetical protein